MTFDPSKLAPAPWAADWGGTNHFEVHCLAKENPGSFFVVAGAECDGNVLDFLALARNDLAVRRRRGWHAEKCSDADQWLVPQLYEYLMRILGTSIVDSGISACYQNGHDVGLLTKADAWYAEHVEGSK